MIDFSYSVGDMNILYDPFLYSSISTPKSLIPTVARNSLAQNM